MPCTAGRAPVAIDRLLGPVKLGTTLCAAALNPSRMKRVIVGIRPAAPAAFRYSGSPPSTHTTATGAAGRR